MQIKQAISYFIISLESEQLSKHSTRAYTQDLNQFYQLVNKAELDDLGFEDFQDYLKSISQLKIASIKRKRVVLNRFLTFCYHKRMCQNKLYEYIDPIRVKKTNKPNDILTQEELGLIFNYLQSEKQRLKKRATNDYYHYLYYCALRNDFIVTFLLYTGCRAHEVVGIKKKDIDLEKNTITLLTKGNKYNPIPIHEALRKAYDEYLESCALLDDKMIQFLEKSLYLFPGKSEGSYLSTRTLHDLMKKLSNVINRPIHAHLFRHTFASYCIANNMDISTISSLISHSNPSITLSIYTHEIDAHNKQEQIKKLKFNL